MPYGKKEFKKDLNKNVARLGQRERQEFIAQLINYHQRVAEPQDGDIQTEDMMTGIQEWVEEYFLPLNKDGTLNKQLSEERIGEFDDFCVDRQLEAGKYLENLGLHTADWKQNYVFEHNPDAPVSYAMGDITRILSFGKYAHEVCDEAYQGGSRALGNHFRNQMKESIQRRLQNATFDEMRALNKGQRLFNADKAHNSDKEKEVKETEAAYDTSQPNFDRACKNYADKLDFSFISNKQAARNFRRAQTEETKTPIRSLADQLGEMEDFLNSKENSRWRDSSYMKAVKKGLKNVRDLIEIQGSGTPEKRAAIAEAYQKLQDSCAAYLEKRSGERSTPAGTKRQQAVGRLAAFLNSNKVVQNMMEEDQRAVQAKQAAEEAARRGPVPGTEMAKLLVMEETGASFHEVQDPGAFKEQKESALARIHQGMAQMKQDPGAMTDIVGKCTKALASIDVRTETLNAIGVNPENLTREQVEIALKAPENHDKVNDFLTNLSNTVKAASGELHSNSLQELRGQMEQDGKWKGTLEAGRRAEKEIVEGLESEVRWNKLRKDYADGYEHVDEGSGINYLTQEHREPYRAAVDLGREQIARGAMSREMRAGTAAKEKHQEAEKMNFNDLSREEQKEHGRTSHRKTISNPEKGLEREHQEPSKEHRAPGK